MEIVQVFETSPSFFLFCVFILSLCIGSFLNVVIYRFPEMMKNEWRCECEEFLELDNKSETSNLTLSHPASSCGNCGHKIRFYENIPILSYLFLRAKCSSCNTPISIQYPLVELLTALLSVVVAQHFGVSIQTVGALILTWVLIAASGIDIGHKLLPDQMLFPLLWLGILLNIFDTYTNLESSVIGAMLGYLSLWSIFWIFKIITKKEGMGYGDFKLLAALGAWVGWKYLFIIVFTSSLVGAIIGVSYLLLKNKERNTQIPFGPYLAIAGWMSLLWGEQLQTIYINVFNLSF